MSATKMTDPNPLEVEAMRYGDFAVNEADPEFRGPLRRMYTWWGRCNEEHFGGGLGLPHLAIGPTSPRRFSGTSLNSVHGGRPQITVAEGIVFGTNARVVRRPWPAQGLMRFVDDLVLAEIVKQAVQEIHGQTEDGYGGYGPLYSAEATRIGATMGLGPVIPRRRGVRGAGLPVAACWPWAFRPAGYYLGDVRLAHRAVGGLRAWAPARLAALPGCYEYFLYLLMTGKADRLRDILERQVEAERERRSPALAAAERGPMGEDGRPRPLPAVDPDWLTWNYGCVAQMAAFIRERRAFDGLPILADALEDAGCSDGLILTHCRTAGEHTANCWVLRLLTPAAGGG